MKVNQNRNNKSVRIGRNGILLMAGAICLSAAVILYRYASVMVGSRSAEARSLQISDYASEHRGNIRDRNGSLLATQTTFTDIVYKVQTEHDLKEYQMAAEILSATLNRPAKEIFTDLSKGGKYRFYKRRASQEEIEALSVKLNEINAAAEKRNEVIKNSAGDDSGYYPSLKIHQFLEENQGRSYPKGELAAHILGFVDFNGTVREGVEKIYDEDLTANKVVDGAVITRDVYLTIDTQIQYMAAKQAQTALSKEKAEAAIFIVMDAQTGEILAMENAPTFNPNFYNRSTPEARMNRAVAYAFEPGSVLKIFTVACAFDTGRVPVSHELFCHASYEIPDSGNPPSVIKCVTPHGRVYPKDAIVLSCNTAACTSTEYLSKNELYTKLRHFGFGQRIGLGLSNENKGVLRRPSAWSGRSLATITMGQEISATALQIVTAATVFANEGRLLRPHIIQSIRDSEGNVLSESTVAISEEVLSYQTVQNILSMMTEGTERGLAQKTAVNGIRLASKTGTAQIFDEKNKRYFDDKYVASALTLFPAEKPRFIVYGAVFSPKAGSIYGSNVTAPLVRDLAEELILYLNVYKETDSLYEISGNLTTPARQPAPALSPGTVPDLTGLSKRDLIGLYSKNFKFHITGEGKVVSQSPEPGSALRKDAVIYVELE